MLAKPNFIIFLTDDQGYGDLSCMGATDFNTPHIDTMAKNGVRATCWYSNSPVCSPSRASLLTGKYPAKAGVRSILAGHRTATGLDQQNQTIPKRLKEQGYQCYMAGKWHLGLSEGCRPQDHGFDHWFGFMAGCIDYYSHIFYWGMNKPGPGVNPTHDLWEDGKEVWLNGKYFTEAIVDKAITYLRQAAQSGKPFFLYLPFNAPHYPMHAPQEYMDRFAHLPWDRQVMAAMISAVDDGIGKIMAEMERLGLADNTCSFFTSDNGPSRESRNWLDGNQDPYYGGTAGALKGHKFSLFEGGIRMPAVIQWPQGLASGKVMDQPVASMDVLPTILEILGQETPENLDGQSMLSSLRGKSAESRTIFWEMGAQTAMRKGDYKLVHKGQLVESEEPIAEYVLTRISTDLGEVHNLVNEEPSIFKSMCEELHNWRNNIDAEWEAKKASGGQL